MLLSLAARTKSLLGRVVTAVKSENENQTVKDDSITSFIGPALRVKSGNEEEVIHGNFSEKIYGRSNDSRFKK